MLKDLIPAAEKAGYAPLFVDMWMHRANAGLALVEALRQAYRQLTVPRSKSMQTLKQPVTSMQVLGMGITLDQLPEPGEPAEDMSRIAYWMARVLDMSNRPILLTIDEAQSMAVEPNGGSVAATLRSLLQQNDDRIRVFFTGSSQHNLSRLGGASAGRWGRYGVRTVDMSPR